MTLFRNEYPELPFQYSNCQLQLSFSSLVVRERRIRRWSTDFLKTESDAQKAAKQELVEDSHDTQYSRMEVAKQ